MSDGDRIVCPDPRSAANIQRHARDMGKRVVVTVVPPSEPGRLLGCPPCDGRTFFEHTFAEAVVLRAIDDAGRLLFDLARLDSRRGAEKPVDFKFDPS